MKWFQSSQDYICCLWTIYKENQERMQKFKERRDLRYIYQNELDIACSQHDMAYGDFKDSTRRTASDNRTMMDIKGVLLQ